MAIIKGGSKRSTPYKHQSWPKMLYHQLTGEYKVFRHQSQVPDDGTWGPKSTVGKTAEQVAEEVQAKDDAKAEEKRVDEAVAAEEAAEQKKDNKAAAQIFKKLKLTREEAEAILKDEGTEFDAEADDLSIAMAVKELLEDGDSE